MKKSSVESTMSLAEGAAGPDEGSKPTSPKTPKDRKSSRSMEGFSQEAKSLLLEGAHLLEVQHREGSTPGSAATPSSEGSRSPGLYPTQPAFGLSGSLQLQRSVTEDVLSRARTMDPLSASASLARGAPLLEQARKAQAAEASLALAKLRTDDEVKKVLEEVRALKPEEGQRELREMQQALDDACQTILNLRADHMDRNQFYSVVATLQGMASRATHTAPGYKQLISKALFTTSRCARLLQYMDIKETTLMPSSMSQSPSLLGGRRGSVPDESYSLGWSPRPATDFGSPEFAGGWQRIGTPVRRATETASESLAGSELGLDEGLPHSFISHRHSFDVMRQSFDDLDALRNFLGQLKENKDTIEEDRKRADSTSSVGRETRPMQCHICDRLVRRERYDGHTEMCVNIGHLTDTLRNCDGMLHLDLSRITLLHDKHSPNPSKPKHRRNRSRNGSFERLLQQREVDRIVEMKPYLNKRDLQTLRELKSICEEALVLEEQSADSEEMAATLCSTLGDLTLSADDVLDDGDVLHDIVAEFLPRLSNTIQERRRILNDIGDLRIAYEGTFATDDSPQSKDSRSRGGSTNRDGMSVSADREKKVSIKDFEILKHVSHGAYGAVFLAQKKNTGDFFAIKKLKKDHMVRKKQVEHVMRERNIMAMTNNPFLVKLFYTFQSKVNLYFVMEFCQGGDLASLLEGLGGFEIEMVRGYVGEMVLALEYLKSQMIVHRDLKPDNILVASDGHIKLTDFGLSYGALVEHVLGGSLELYDEMGGRGKTPDVDESTGVEVSKKRYSEVGTPHYLAPEILTGIGHSYPVDYWAVGVMMYEFFVGCPPFTGPDLAAIFQRITCCDIEWMEDVHIPEEGKDLICRLLTIDPEQRIGSGPDGIADLKCHPFFAGVDWGTFLEKPVVFVPQPDHELDTGYFVEKPDDEKLAEWSFESESEQLHGSYICASCRSYDPTACYNCERASSKWKVVCVGLLAPGVRWPGVPPPSSLILRSLFSSPMFSPLRWSRLRNENPKNCDSASSGLPPADSWNRSISSL